MNLKKLFKQLLIGCCTVVFTLTSTGIYAQSKKYTEKELTTMSVEELALLRNEVLARKGYVFSNGIYSSYFEMQKWYNPAKSNNLIVLDANENAQVDLIKKIENQKKAMRTKAISDLKEIKKAVNANNKALFDKYVFDKENRDANLMDSFKTILNTCNLDGINWTKNQGLYKVTIDNGDAVSVIYIKFSNTQVILSEGRIEHSEIFGDFSDGYSSYESESEYTQWFYFNITEQGLKFVKWDMAG